MWTAGELERYLETYLEDVDVDYRLENVPDYLKEAKDIGLIEKMGVNGDVRYTSKGVPLDEFLSKH